MSKFLAIVMTTTGLTLSSAFAMETVEKPYVAEKTSRVQTLSGYEKLKDTLLRNFDVLNYDVIDDYRIAFQQIETENQKFIDAAVVEPMAMLEPLAKELLVHVESLSEKFPQLNVLKKEIEYRLVSEQVTPIWYLSLGFRVQAALSDNISDDERNLIKHTFHPGSAILEGLTNNNAWKVFEKSFGYFAGYRHPQKGLGYFNYLAKLDYQSAGKVLESLGKRLPAPVMYPLFGNAKVGIPFLVHSQINDIFPIGMPAKTGKAHGVKLSPLGFAIHDFLHSYADQRRESLTQFVFDELEICLKDGDIQLKSKALIIDQAVARYTLLNNALNTLFNHFLTDLSLHEEQTQKYKRAITGLFWLLHEETSFDSRTYKTGIFVDILKGMAGISTNTEGLSVSSTPEAAPQSWESPKDPYVTSPFTGEPMLSDHEIAALAQESLHEPRLSKDSPYKVKLTDRFIDVKFTSDSAAKVKESMPTLHHKWLNADDNIALLKYAGVTIDKPSLEGLKQRDARVIVLATLTKIEEEIQKLKSDFIDYATQLSNEKWLGNYTVSLADDYQAKFEALTTDYADTLKKSIS